MGVRAVRYILDDMGEIRLAIEAMIVIRYLETDLKLEKGVLVPCWDSEAVSTSWYPFAVSVEHGLVLALMLAI
jgi:hypothetical protein